MSISTGNIDEGPFPPGPTNPNAGGAPFPDIWNHPIKIDLLVGHDASVADTPSQAICLNYAWNITVCFDSIVGGPPIIKIEVSNDGVKWFDYNECATNSTTDTFAFYDSILAFPYIRLNYDPNGTTGGTIDASLILKPC